MQEELLSARRGDSGASGLEQARVGQTTDRPVYPGVIPAERSRKGVPRTAFLTQHGQEHHDVLPLQHPLIVAFHFLKSEKYRPNLPRTDTEVDAHDQRQPPANVKDT